MNFTVDSLSVDGWNITSTSCFTDIAPHSKGYVNVGCSDDIKSTNPQRIAGSIEVSDTSYSKFLGVINKYEFSFDSEQ